jgi:hypothetical protein
VRSVFHFVKKATITDAFFLAAFLFLCMTVSGNLAAQGNRDVKVVTVKAGDSLSYLSFKMYGEFSEQISAAIQSYNPGLKNINLIYPGQKLNFPRLSVIEAQEAAKPSAIPPVIPKSPIEVPSKKPPVVTKPSEIQKEHEKEMTTKAPPPKDKMQQETAYVTYLNGEAKVKSEDAKQWKPIQVNQKINQGDQVRVGKKSKAELMTFDRDVVRLSENTELTVDKMQNNPVRKIKKKGFFMKLGRVWNKAKSLVHSKSEYTVRTPNAISGIRGTSYSVDVDQEQNTLIKTYAGAVRVWRPQVQEAGPGWRLTKPTKVAGPHPVSRKEWTEIILKLHQELFITKQGATRRDFDPVLDEKKDDWVRWNKQRDGELDDSERFL